MNAKKNKSNRDSDFLDFDDDLSTMFLGSYGVFAASVLVFLVGMGIYNYFDHGSILGKQPNSQKTVVIDKTSSSDTSLTANYNKRDTLFLNSIQSCYQK